MKDRPGNSFADRANAAAAAKKALLDKYRPQPTQLDPLHAEREKMREAEMIRVREQRAAEKAAKRQVAADAAAEAERAHVASQAALQLEVSERQESKAMSEAEAKAKRDAKYAARKARK